MFMLLFSLKVTFDPFLVALRLLAVYIVWFRLSQFVMFHSQSYLSPMRRHV